MSPQNRPVDSGLVENSRFNKHIIMGYVFLALVFMGAVSSVYYWEHKAKISANNNSLNMGVVESGEQSIDAPGMCAQMVVKAREKNTGEIREFPTLCDVNTDWWEIIKN